MSTPKTGSKKQVQDGDSKPQDGEKRTPKESKTKTKSQTTRKPPDQKKSPILDVAAGVEGMTTPPADMGPPEEEEEAAEEEEDGEDEEPHYNPWRRVVTSTPRPPAAQQAARTYGTRRARPETSRSAKKAGKSGQSKKSAKAAGGGGSSRRKSSKGRQGSPTKKSDKVRQRSSQEERTQDDEKEEEKPTTEVKQFAFPYYKILSGASVAPVRMLPQKIVIKPSCEPDESRPRHWAAGLFQNTKMSVKLRLLRLFLVWLFFRMMNRQAMWLSEKLDLGQPDPADGMQKPPPSGPGEKYIRVFHEGTPNPFHMKFTPGMNPKDGFRPPPPFK